jgi:hypothetical protein
MGNNNHVVVIHKLCGFRDVWVGVLSWWSQLWLRQSSSLFVTHFLSSVSKHYSKSQSWP